MGSRDLSHALIVAGLAVALGGGPLATSRAAQGSGLTPNLQRIQDAAVAAERRELFFERWESAPGSLRDAAAEALATLRPEGRRLDGWPTTAELALAIRVLDGIELVDLRDDPLIAFADAIGLLVVPGVALVGPEPERGEPLTVRVHQMQRVELQGPLELDLLWRASDGSEERARREPFPAEAFLRGFPMYLRAPHQAGSWGLVPEVTYQGRTVRGFEVPFETLATQDLDRSRGSSELLQNHGVRSPGGSSQAVREGPPDGSARGTLLVVTGRGEDPDSFAHGRIGARWRTLAAELELELVVLPAGDLASRLSPAGSDRPPSTFLLARGEAVAELHLALLGQEASVAGIVLSTSMTAPGPALPDVPTLLVGPQGHGEGDAKNVLHLRGGRTPFLTEPDLPALVAPWLRQQLDG